MKAAVNIVRFFVGSLFIISGFVKANDPLGLGYKMQEFFEVWNASLSSGTFLYKTFSFFHEEALTLSLIMITLEIMAGIALILGWKKKGVLALLLTLIIFFTFLTAYAYWSGKFKNCGCFGDCLPITPLTSFGKDVLLLIMILFLIAKQRFIKPFLDERKNLLALILCFVFIVFLQWYVLHYLPLVDCLPYKKENNIAEQMRPPVNAVQDSFVMKFIYERGGKRFEFAPEELPADLATYKFIDRKEKLIRKGNAEPPIKGFSLVGLNGTDYTTSILSEPKAILVATLDFNDVADWMPYFKNLYSKAKGKNIPVFVVSADPAKGKIVFSSLGFPEVVFLSCDATAIKTAARVQPTIFYLEKGTIKTKISYRKLDAFVAEL